MPGELMVRVRELGIRRVLSGYPPRIVTNYGVARVNPNAWKQLRRWVGGNIVSEHVKARPDLYAWLRPWNGELWLYRVATDAYVDYPPGRVIEAVRRLLPSAEPIRLGTLYGRPEHIEFGARYAEAVLGYGVDGVVKGLWVRAGDDGYTAIRVRPFIGLVKEISAIILPSRVSRRLHIERETSIEERLRIDVDASIATLRAFDIEELTKYPVPFTVVNNIARKVRNFAIYWREVRGLGENAYALAIALGRALVSSSGEARERVARLLGQLTSDPARFIKAYSEASNAPVQGD
ncbi:hypothetical protein JCM16161A_02190 [Vulcanisaeta sp. JCM 16161]